MDLRYIDKTQIPSLPTLELYSHKFNLANSWIGIADERIAWLSFTTPSREAIQSYWRGEIRVYADRLGGRFGKMPESLEPIINGSVEFPLTLLGTPFQISVWKMLLEIPVGQTVTYGDIAKAMSQPKHARAVGNAVGANPIACFVPCHRVLPSNHKVGNYRWGPLLKSRLLETESLCI